MKELCEETGLPYFTAAGSNLIDWYQYRDYGIKESDVEQEFTNDNDHWGADLAGRVLNDFNHMVTHWTWYVTAKRPAPWIGAQRFLPHQLVFYFESLQEVIDYKFDPSQFSVLGNNEVFLMISLKYWYLKQLSHTFDVGCRFRYCESDPALPYKDMWYTFGQKPAIVASAARNPDKSWTIAIVNLTGCTSDTLPTGNDWHPQPFMTYYDPDTIDVTINVEELTSNAQLQFAQYRSSKTERFECVDTLQMTNGAITVPIGPKQLITLRGAKNASVTAARKQSAVQHGAIAHSLRSGQVLITFPSAGSYSVELLDVSGRTVHSQRDIRCEGPSRYSVRLSEVGRGMYLVRVLCKGRPSAVNRIIYD
jgi:hypothetical protein